MKANRLILFLPSTLLGFFYSIFYRDPFEHVAIESQGILWDSDLKRGTFGCSDADLKKRPHIALEFDGDVTDWLVAHNTRRHKWRGFWGWLFNAKPGQGLYNFDMAWLALLSVGIVSGRMPRRVTGLSLLNSLISYERDIGSGCHTKLINQVLRVVQFSRADEVVRALSGSSCVEVSNSIINAILLATNKKTLPEALIAVYGSNKVRYAVTTKLHRLMAFVARCNAPSSRP